MKTKKTVTILISITLMLAALAMTGMACLYGGSTLFGVTGEVYEWVDAPAGATSQIHIRGVEIGEKEAELLEEMDAEISANHSLTPLEGAEITADMKHMLEKVSDIWSFKLRSDAMGEFDGGVAIPKRSIYVLRVTKPGYKELITEIDNTVNAVIGNALVVLLVKEGNTE
jgi:hypothetical protein